MISPAHNDVNLL